MQKKKAILIGATGLTGGFLLDALLMHPDFDEVVTYGRSTTGKKSSKLKEVSLDIVTETSWLTELKADVVFCCIGTTKAKTPDQAKYKAIDYGVPVKLAEACKRNGIGHFIVISALGANPKSSIAYNQIKGEMERDVLAQSVEHTYIMQPSLILGGRDEKRAGEKIAQIVMPIFHCLMVGGLKKYRAIKSTDIALAMLKLSLQTDHTSGRIPSDEIKRIAAW
ncbi:NAD(P)H-binding [Lishizhenia tianjinensis]|uniref:NAD(P)H-binding n=1 Tax=Lishizhenia tianjinensis TaxID=477690 RepID=A0A1I7AZE0_9FLAO|nr:NAD(P)H-binding protein [Lishizhenia tianjinensis]SFT80289.1 NAD(P)H-binding [Lishizhenia tianjinensis]